MKKITTLTFFFALLFAALTQQAQAQTTFEIGPRIGYEIDEVSALQLGADARISAGNLPIVINPTFDYFFLDQDDFGDTKLMQFNLNALYRFGIDNQVFTPYVGAGLALTRVSFDTNGIGDFLGVDDDKTTAGLNVVAGAQFGGRAMRPFVQVQTTVGGDIQTASVVGGLLFSLGR